MANTENTFEEWKKVLLTLSDEIFFSLMRNYLGELKTPFNKHTIITDLFNLFNKPTMLDMVDRLLSADDLALLTGISSFEGPTQADLQGFLGLTPLEISQRLLNLEERLLVYRIKTSRGPILKLSPLLENERFKKKLNPTLLFSPRPAENLPAPKLWLTEDSLLAMLSYLLEKPLLVAKTGPQKKKLSQELETRFSSLTGADTPGAIDLLQAALLNLGLILVEGDTLRFNWPAWKDLATQPEDRLQALVWTAAIGFSEANLLRIAPWLKVILESLPPGLAFSAQSLSRWLAHSTPLKDFHENLKIFEGLVQIRVLLRSAKGFLQTNPQLGRPAASTDRPPVVVQANFEISINPGLTLADGLFLAQACELRSFDVVSHFELSKAAALRAFSFGNTALGLVTALEKLARHNLPQNLRISLTEWEKEAKGVRLIKGVVMLVEESRRYTLEHTPGFTRWVLGNLAPGIFLVKEEGLPAWRKELQQMGLPVLPELENLAADAELGVPWAFARWDLTDRPPPLPDTAIETEASTGEEADLQTFFSQLETDLDKLTFMPEERLELKARIRRRLIFTSAQLTAAAAKGEKAEAKGLDYLGKIRLIEQALASLGDYLELVQRDEEGHPIQARVRPAKLEKQGKEVLLLGENLETRQAFKAYVSRLGSVKKIRSSLFG